MSRPPKAIGEPFFGPSKILLGCTQGAGILLICLMVYFIGYFSGCSEKTIRTMTFVTLIASNISVILANRSWTTHIFEILVTPNKSVKWVIGGAVLFLLLILNVPFLLQLFQFEKVSFWILGLCLLGGFLSIVWFELYKIFLQRKRKIIHAI